MKHQIVVQAPNGPCPLEPRELETTPQIGAMLSGEIEGMNRQIEVVAVQFLPVVAGGTFAHDEAWVICRLA